MKNLSILVPVCLVSVFLFAGEPATAETVPAGEIPTYLQLQAHASALQAQLDQKSQALEAKSGMDAALAAQVKSLQSQLDEATALCQRYYGMMLQAQKLAATTAEGADYWKGEATVGQNALKAEFDRKINLLRSEMNSRAPQPQIRLQQHVDQPKEKVLVLDAPKPETQQGTKQYAFPLNPKVGQVYVAADGLQFRYYNRQRDLDQSKNFLGWHEIEEGQILLVAAGDKRVCHRTQAGGRWQYQWLTQPDYDRAVHAAQPGYQAISREVPPPPVSAPQQDVFSPPAVFTPVVTPRKITPLVSTGNGVQAIPAQQ